MRWPVMGNVGMHHHLICLGCGQILDVMDDG